MEELEALVQKRDHTEARLRLEIFSLPQFLCEKKAALLEQWIKDEIIQLPKVEPLPTAGNIKHPKIICTIGK